MIKKINFSELFSSSLIGNTFKLSVSNIVVLVSVVVLTPIISRIYTPAMYGTWGVFSNVLMICNSMLFLTYDYAIIQSEEKRERVNLLGLCIFIALMVSLMVYTFLGIGALFDISFCKTFPSKELLVLCMLSYAVYYLLSVLANRASLYNVIAIISVIYGLAQPLLRILLGELFMNNNSLIYANLITQAIGIVCFIIGMWKGLKLSSIRLFDIRTIIPLAKKFKKYPLFDAPSYVIETLCSCVVIIILSLYYSRDEIGCYSMILQLIILPVTMVGSSMSKVFFRDLSSVQDNVEDTKQLFIKTAQLALLLSCLPVIFFSLGGDKLVGFFLGKEWTMASDMTLCLAIFSLPIVLSEPLLPIFRAQNKQEVRFKFNILNLIVTSLTLFVGIKILKNIILVLLLYSVGNAILRFLLLKAELKQVNLKLCEINRYSLFMILSCYILLSIRIVLILL